MSTRTIYVVKNPSTTPVNLGSVTTNFSATTEQQFHNLVVVAQLTAGDVISLKAENGDNTSFGLVQSVDGISPILSMVRISD